MAVICWQPMPAMAIRPVRIPGGMSLIAIKGEQIRRRHEWCIRHSVKMGLRDRGHHVRWVDVLNNRLLQSTAGLWEIVVLLARKGDVLAESLLAVEFEGR